MVSKLDIDWDVHVPFNEGVEMARGVGSVDANGNRAVDFSRASTTGNINKSGQSETVAIDTPSIRESGLDCVGSYTSLLRYSNDFTNGIWNKVGVTASSNSITESASTGQHFVSQPRTIVSGTEYCLQCKVKSQDIQYIRLQGGAGFPADADFDLFNGRIVKSTLGKASIEKVDGDFYLISLINKSNGTSSFPTLFILDPTGQVTSFPGNGVSTLDVKNFTMSDTNFISPYIETTTIPVVRSADISSFDSLGNLPAIGESFYIFSDVKIDVSNKTVRYILDHNQSETNGWSLHLDEFGTLFFTASGGANAVFASHSGITESGIYNICIGFDGEMIKLYVDGAIKGDNGITLIDYDFLDAVSVGSDFANGNHLNSSIKNLRIKNGDLTDEEIKLIAGV